VGNVNGDQNTHQSGHEKGGMGRKQGDILIKLMKETGQYNKEMEKQS
jgi:hypothetical protein